MKEEIDLALSTLEEMKESDDTSFIGDRANVVKTLMKSIELSCTAHDLSEIGDEIEPWDLEEEYEDVEEEE